MPMICQSPSHSRKRPAGQGFTLLEIMIAISIFALVMTSIYSTWSAILRGSRAGRDSAAQVQRTRMAFRCLVDSLLSIQMFGANADYYAFLSDTRGDFAALSFVAHLPASFPHSGLFGDQVLRRVTFQVEPSQDYGNQLAMYQVPVLQEDNPDQQPLPIILARNLGLFTVDFWNTRSGEWDTEWLYTNQLPKMIRINLGFGRPGSYQIRPEDMVTRIISLPAMVIPREYQLVPNVPTRPGVPRPNPGGGNTPGGNPGPAGRPNPGSVFNRNHGG